jgi:hypothetical protein
MKDMKKLLKDIDPKLLEDEQFQRLIEAIEAQDGIMPAPAAAGDKAMKRTLSPYIDAPSILLDCAWK